MRTFVNPVHLVTTTDGLRPENFVEVKVLPNWEAAITKKNLDDFEQAVASAKEEEYAKPFLIVPDIMVESMREAFGDAVLVVAISDTMLPTTLNRGVKS